MECSPYRKFSIFWKGARFHGPNSGFLLAGTWIVPLSGTRGSGSCLEAGGNDTRVFFPNSLPLISRFRHRSRGITCALKSTGVAHYQQAPLRQDPVPLVLLASVQIKPELILNPDIRLIFSSLCVKEIILNFEFRGPRSAEMYDFLGNTSNGFFPYIFLCLLFPISALLAFPYLLLKYFFSSFFAYAFLA
ncbi:hypothetical protein DY000_02050133 [Brassica cretica]|uniref:Uncharacterized protein n=1 Tax=Brassica cretica TaxID=69181 RepID=A0ABQ7ET55_BRACR|nr:hypothetical protein DY000_02050133 [Brassica cretica]